MITDQLSRPLRDLRISVTDRCSFRCRYCMPKEIFGVDYDFLRKEDLLSYEEIARLARLFVGLGAGKIRITGGEPLLRRELDKLVGMLRKIDGLQDLTLTTNGVLLKEQAAVLRAAGLQRVTVSLDSLDNHIFQAMNGVGVQVDDVLHGIESALEAGFEPIKINVVVQRGMNERSIVDLARHFRGTGCIVRFIEYMDVGNSNGWQLDQVVTAAEILRRIQAEFPLQPVERNYREEVAQRWRYRSGQGEIGIIASVSQPFCGDCSRARLSPEGKLYTCLFAASGHDLRALLRNGASDTELAAAVTGIWMNRQDRYSEIRSTTTAARPKVEMSHIGG